MNKQEIYAFLKEKNIWHEIMAFLSSMKGGNKPAENTEVIDNA